MCLLRLSTYLCVAVQQRLESRCVEGRGENKEACKPRVHRGDGGTLGGGGLALSAVHGRFGL